MSGPAAYLNGRFLPQADAHLPLHDAGFIFGATVTDFCRTFRHRLFRLPDHLARFRRSCEAACIPQPVPNDELAGLAEQLVAHNAALLSPQDDLALVLFATPGSIGAYAGLPDNGPPTLGMHTFPLPGARFRRFFTQGASLVVPRVRQVPAVCVDPRIKQRSRLHWWLADQEVQKPEPGAVALLLDLDGQVTETAAANLLIVHSGRVLTPPRATVLEGISLLTIQELCADLGIGFEEQPLSLDDCRSADEAMLANTSFCLAPVWRIDGSRLPCPGPIFERLLHLWSDRVGLDIRAQILAAR